MTWLPEFKYHWRVWLAFENDPPRPEYARALAATCRRSNSRLDVAEYERWLDVLVENRWGVA